MKFISRLAKGSLKSNKSKSLLIGITIMLTTVLLTSIGIICAGWIESNKEVTIERSGSHHALYKRATYDEIRVIENNIDIEKFGVMTTVGISSFEGNNLGIAYLDENGKEMANVEFVQGVMPKSNDEIAIQDGYLKLLGQEVKVGDKIKLEYESRGTGILKEKEFTISGLMKTSDFNVGNKNYSAVISEQFLRQEEAYVDMEFNTYVRVNDEDNLSGNDIEFKVKEVATNVGINEYDVRINEDYINAMKPDMGVVGGGIAIVLIVILSSILVIYSIFYVSIITKVQEYGKLRAVGATKRQIKCIILREGMVLAAIAIPIGLVVGYFVGDIIIDKLVIKGMYEVGKFNVPIMVSVMIVSFITVFVSLLKPMKIAASVSPVEAIRYNGEESNKKKERIGYEFLNISRLTYANISRNKKRAIVTLASLGLSGILFITMSTVMSSMNAEKMAREGMVGDFKLTLDNYTYGENDEPLAIDFNMVQENNPLDEELRNQLMEIPGVKEVVKSVSTWFEQEMPSGEEYTGTLSGFDEEYVKVLEEKLVEGEINYESLKKGNGVIYTYPSFAEENGIKVGEKVKLTIYDGSETFEKEFVVEGISYVGGSDFIVPNAVIEGMIKADITDSIDIIVEGNSLDSLETILKPIVDGNQFIELKTFSDEIKLYEDTLNIMKVLGYALVAIIGVIGFMNLINTMITSIITRKRELGMLQAIGLSNKQLVRMLQVEGLFYTAGTLLITLTLGNVVGYIAYSAFKNAGASYAVYTYPLMQTIILIVSITVAQLAITYLVSNNFNKQSLVDRVRYSE